MVVAGILLYSTMGIYKEAKSHPKRYLAPRKASEHKNPIFERRSWGFFNAFIVRSMKVGIGGWF